MQATPSIYIGEPVHVAYLNPETGQECLPTLGFSALMLRPGEDIRLRRRSASAVLHVIEGSGSALIDDTSLPFGESDTLAAPTHAEIRLTSASGKSPAFLFMVDARSRPDAPSAAAPASAAYAAGRRRARRRHRR
ncbi:MAG: hypothetical protein ACREVG_09605 [Burkholderiales bacterium]